MDQLRKILLPFSWLYGIIIFLRNKLYDNEILRSAKFLNFPIISVGNLEVGGSGKTPTTEYLIRLLKNNIDICILSRGYGRKTKGFRWVNANDSFENCGDEPLQIKSNFPEVGVAVCEDRVHGIKQINKKFKLAILDDAYQHRALKAGLSILLFNYVNIHKNKFLLPAGNYREAFGEYKRADIILITKCPDELSIEDRNAIKIKFSLVKEQNIFFAKVKYSINLIHINNALITQDLNSELSVLLVTGIAEPQIFAKKIKANFNLIDHISFSDHHQFSRKDISLIINKFELINGNKKLILTTQKDAIRLKHSSIYPQLKNLPLYYWPIELDFINSDEKIGFDTEIINYVRSY